LPLELSSYLSQFQRYKYFRFWGPHCHFRLSVIVAITWRHFIRAGHGRKSRTFRWNFDAICCSSSGITISGFGGYIATSGCRSMLQSLVGTFCQVAWPKTTQVCRRNCSDICHTVRNISTSDVDGHIAISGCSSMSHLFVDTFLSLTWSKTLFTALELQ